MLRVLQSVNKMDRAGLETMLMNYYRNIDRSKIQFDFLTHRVEKGAYDEEIESLGGKVYHAPRLYPQNYPQYFEFLKDFFGVHPEYKIIHSHFDSMSFFPLLAAKKSDIPIRIGHSHTSKLDMDFKFPIKYLALKGMPRVANVYCACGALAGKFMWREREFKIIHNAVNLTNFTFDLPLRRDMRQKLNIAEDTFVVGHVGRFTQVKNQLFLLDVFKELVQIKANSFLILIGSGEDEEKIKNKIHDLGLEDKIAVLVDRSDVNELYQAMDIFVIPSIFEGLPVVGVEAQANGLPCIFSDNISEEIILSSNAERYSLGRSEKEWAERILSKASDRNPDAFSQLQANGYDIKQEARKLQDWYLGLE